MELIDKDNEAEAYQKYDRAKKRVLDIKRFYNHVKIYVICNILLLIARAFLINYLELDTRSVEFKNWFNWNTLLTPLLWGIGLIAHGIYVFQFKSNLMKDWEEKKIQEIIKKEQEASKNFWE